MEPITKAAAACAEQSEVAVGPLGLCLELNGWRVFAQTKYDTVWKDVEGDVVTLTWGADLGELGPQPIDDDSVRHFCRELAESREAGLIEAALVDQVEGPAVQCVYKRLEMPGFMFSGMLVLPTSRASWVWMVITSESGITGVREAAITKQLFTEGRLTVERYETSWAQDPYDPTYDGVDRKTLRYLSDDQEYDPQFPKHPLSKLRRELRRLLSVKLDPEPSASPEGVELKGGDNAVP